MSFDAEAYRRASLEHWEEAAAGWRRRSATIRSFGAPVSHRMLELAELGSGERVLELAAGLGETGLLAAEIVAPVGRVVISDQAEAMLEGARERATELGTRNVQFTVLNAEWIDLPLASIDVVLCRWGYMLMADPAVALSETRRVLRPGGRLSLAVWDELEANPWASLPGLELAERGLAPPAGGAQPGPFSLARPGAVRELLEQAGFAEISLETLELERRHRDFEDLWDTTLDISRVFHDAVMSQSPEVLEQVRASLRARFGPYTDADGSLTVPARTLLARAEA